jgi:hypothetical protein
LLEDFEPGVFVVPEILVSKEDHVEGVAEFFMAGDLGGVRGEKLEVALMGGAGALGLGEIFEVFAAAGFGVGDFAVAYIDADEIDAWGGLVWGGGVGRSEVVGEGFGFVAIAAGEVEDAEGIGMILVKIEAVEGVVEEGFEAGEVFVEEVVEELLAHGRAAGWGGRGCFGGAGIDSAGLGKGKGGGGAGASGGRGCQVSGVRCQVSGVRCQVSGVRCQRSEAQSEHG